MPLTLVAPNVSVNKMLRSIRVESLLGVLHLNYTPSYIVTLHIFCTLKAPDNVYVSHKVTLIKAKLLTVLIYMNKFQLNHQFIL